MGNSHSVVREQKRQAWALLQEGHYRRARSLYARVCEIDPSDGEAWLMLAMVNGELGNYEEAEHGCRRALDCNPQLGQAHYVLGKVLKAQGALEQAADQFRRALALGAIGAEVYNDLGSTLAALGQLEQSVDCYHQALRRQPRYARALCNLGVAQSLMGRFEEALESYRQLLAMMPGNPDAIVGIAEIHGKRGDFDAAYAVLRPVLPNTKNPRVAIGFGSVARQLGRRREAIALLEGLLNDDQVALQPDDARSLNFQLAKLYDETDQYDRAFDHYRRGNRLGGTRFDLNSHVSGVAQVIAAYSKAFMEQAPRSEVLSRRPVFIVGMPRSGTTLVEQILASHPQVWGAGELNFIPSMVAAMPTLPGTDIADPAYVKTLTTEECSKLAQAYLDRLADVDAESVRVTDKMVDNFLNLGLIALLFPRARVVHCVRNALDTCLSCFFQDFALGHGYAGDLEQLGVYYREYRRLMRHWREVIDLPLLEVQYEELVADQESASRALIEFCGLAWDDACLRFYEHDRVANTASYDQVRRPIYTGSVGRWRRYEAYLDPLKKALQI